METNDKLREACEALVSEIGGYSADGLEFIWCRISGETVRKARAALATPRCNWTRTDIATETSNILLKALARIKDIADNYEQCATKAGALDNIYELACTALATPRRNCDVGTAEEQKARFNAFCDQRVCTECGLSMNGCRFAWGQMPYKEGGAK